MYISLLFIHILLALSTIAASVVVFVRVRRRVSPAKSLLTMWANFAGVVVTGGLLVVMLPTALGHACLLVSVYVALTSGMQVYAKRVVASAL